jgi:hypothetical protein
MPIPQPSPEALIHLDTPPAPKRAVRVSCQAVCRHPLQSCPIGRGFFWSQAHGQKRGLELRMSCQELRTGSDDEGDHVIGSLERIRAFEGCTEIRTVDIVLDSKVAMPSVA